MPTAPGRFELLTDWQMPFPLPAVWDALVRPEEWPTWWPAVLAVELLEPDDANGIGAYRRLTWRTALPYRITFNMRTTRVGRHELIEGCVDGELTGLGRWTLAPADPSPISAGTHVRYEWVVDVTKPWMRLVVPLARPVFAWNHRVVLEWGRQGLTRKLLAQESRGQLQAPL